MIYVWTTLLVFMPFRLQSFNRLVIWQFQSRLHCFLCTMTSKIITTERCAAASV